MAILGIDLGTTNSLAAYWQDGAAHLIADENGDVLFPSAVCYLGEEGLAAGRQAKERMLMDSQNTVCSFKRFMGTDKTYVLGGQAYTPMELSAMVLKRIKNNAESVLQEQVEEAIITVPAYFNDKQRSDTKKAAQLAGLHAERLINEPSAAALAYRLKYGEEDKTLLVFDFGGGTLDLSYVECFDNIIEIVAVTGDNYLGGDDVDRLIAEYFCEKNGLEWERLSAQARAQLKSDAEMVKQRLEQEEEIVFSPSIDGASYHVCLNDDILFDICMPLFTKIKKLFLHILKDADAKASDIDDLIMVGGSSRLHTVKRFLMELLGKEPIVLGETDKVVAMGAGAYAGIRMRNQDIRDMLLTDVCPFTLGIECWHKETSAQGYLLPMIERNSTLPATRCQHLVTLSDYQKEILVRIYQGEEYYAEDNLYLGEIKLPVQPKPAGQEGVDVYFSYDINGILYVEAVNSHKTRNHILLANQTLSQKELERYQGQLEQLLIPPIQKPENQAILHELVKYYENSVGKRREELDYLINWFVEGLQSGRQHIILHTIAETKHQLALLQKSEEELEELLFDGELKRAIEEGQKLYDEEYDDIFEEGGGNQC